MYADFTKASDNTDQNILLHKLDAIGFAGHFVKFMSSYKY